METGIGLLVLALIGAIGIMIVKRLDKRDDRLRDQVDAEIALRRRLREIATIEQVTKFTTGGWVSVLLFWLSMIISLVSYSQAKTVFQEIEASVALIAATLLFGLGMVLLRKTTYCVLQRADEAPPALPEQPETPLAFLAKTSRHGGQT